MTYDFYKLQMALAGFAEHVLHLSRCNPDMLYIHQDSGLINISYFKLVLRINLRLN